MDKFKKRYISNIINFRNKVQQSDQIDRRRPRFVEEDTYKFQDTNYSRLRIILRSNGCSIPTCTMCPFPNEKAYLPVSHEDYIEQVKSALAEHPDCEIVSIYNDGSFFASAELEDRTRTQILEMISEYSCKFLMVESIPCFITEDKIAQATEILGKIQLVIGIGLESLNDEIRELCVCTKIKMQDVIHARDIVRKYNHFLKVYLLLKAPFLMEDEAVKDVIDSCTWLNQNGISDLTICPLRISEGTVVKSLYDFKLYTPPLLTSLARVLEELNQRNINTRVSVFNVKSSDIKSVTSYGCKNCQEAILDGVAKYNKMEPVDFSMLRCPECEKRIENKLPEVFANLSYKERIEYWMCLLEGKEEVFDD